MTSDILSFLPNIISGIIIAIVTAFLTVKFSLHQFRSEKLWERKITAYEKIIEALHYSLELSRRWIEEEYEQSKLSKEAEDQLRLKVNAANDEIAKVIDIGSFLFSSELVLRLKQYEKDTFELKKASSWHEHLHLDFNQTKSCIDDIIEIAKKDIKK